MGDSLPFISIIVPVYQVEQYIEKCFSSIDQQTYQNFECIFVDDCGKDRSMEILENLIKASPNREKYSVIHHEKNRGLSAARNSGLDSARGEYILFIDSDDYLLPESLELLTEPLKTENYDLILGRYQRIVDGTVNLSPAPDFPEGLSVMDKIYLMRGELWLCAHNRLIKKRLLDKYQIRFIEGLLWEDNPFSLKLFNSISSFCFLKEPTYAYIVRENSICTTWSEKHYNSWLRNLEEMERITEESSAENLTANLKMLGSFRLRILILSQRYGIRRQLSFMSLLRKKGFSEKEYQLLEGKQKLLYIQHKMPKFLAGIYVVSFSFLYRLLLEW